MALRTQMGTFSLSIAVANNCGKLTADRRSTATFRAFPPLTHVQPSSLVVVVRDEEAVGSNPQIRMTARHIVELSVVVMPASTLRARELDSTTDVTVVVAAAYSTVDNYTG